MDRFRDFLPQPVAAAVQTCRVLRAASGARCPLVPVRRASLPAALPRDCESGWAGAGLGMERMPIESAVPVRGVSAPLV